MSRRLDGSERVTGPLAHVAHATDVRIVRAVIGGQTVPEVRLTGWRPIEKMPSDLDFYGVEAMGIEPTNLLHAMDYPAPHGPSWSRKLPT